MIQYFPLVPQWLQKEASKGKYKTKKMYDVFLVYDIVSLLFLTQEANKARSLTYDVISPFLILEASKI